MYGELTYCISPTVVKIFERWLFLRTQKRCSLPSYKMMLVLVVRWRTRSETLLDSLRTSVVLVPKRSL